MNYSLRATYKIKQSGNKTREHADLELSNKETQIITVVRVIRTRRSLRVMIIFPSHDLRFSQRFVSDPIPES
jgi:hypothetical protein